MFFDEHKIEVEQVKMVFSKNLDLISSAIGLIFHLSVLKYFFLEKKRNNRKTSEHRWMLRTIKKLYENFFVWYCYLNELFVFKTFFSTVGFQFFNDNWKISC